MLKIGTTDVHELVKPNRHLVRCFAINFTATDTAFLKLQGRIAETCERASSLQGAVEVDESYFGPHRVRGKRGQGAYGKILVFGLLKRQGKVYTEIVPDSSKGTQQAVIRGHIDPAAVIHSDGWRGYDGLVDIGFDKHVRMNHSAHEFTSGERHIKGIESFWSYAKRYLTKLWRIQEDVLPPPQGNRISLQSSS